MASNLRRPALSILRDVKQKNEFVYLRSDSLDIRFQTQLVEVKDDHLIVQNKVPPELILQFTKGMKFYLQARMLRLQTSALKAEGYTSVFIIEEDSQITETRTEERFFFSAHENVTCEILNPLDNQTVLVRPVLDMSSGGLSLRAFKDSLLFKPGRIIPSLRVIIEKKPYNHVAGEVVYWKKFMDIHGIMSGQVGVRILGSVKD